VVEPGRAERNYWRDLWPLAWRDLAVRYKQTVIGVASAGESAKPGPSALSHYGVRGPYALVSVRQRPG
jgi:hypothetical protein